MNEIDKVLEDCPNNLVIFDSFVKSNAVINEGNYKSIQVAVSGGSDSDIVMDIVKKVYHGLDIHFVYFDTGIEFQGTKDHLKLCEEKYGVEIKKIRAIKPIPVSVREYGVPFLSKYASEMISRLQKHNFDFATADDYTLEEQLIRHPRCKVALKWFYNDHDDLKTKDGKNMMSRFSISRNKGLREFMIKHPPTFKISNKCCYWAKKKVAENYQKENNIDLNIIGVRKSEGGARSSIGNCFTRKDDISNYRPIFWYNNFDKLEYNQHYNIINSICYSKYGMSRTGCAGCPFAKDFEKELEIIKTHEPKLFKAVNKIFGDSYEYTRKYNEFKEKL